MYDVDPDQARATRRTGFPSLSGRAALRSTISLHSSSCHFNLSETGIAAMCPKNHFVRSSDEQVNELHSVLPDSFIKMDQQFHYYAGILGHAASNRKPELVGFYLSKMGESCVICHSQHAIHRFPGLVEDKQEGEHLH